MALCCRGFTPSVLSAVPRAAFSNSLVAGFVALGGWDTSLCLTHALGRFASSAASRVCASFGDSGDERTMLDPAGRQSPCDPTPSYLRTFDNALTHLKHLISNVQAQQLSKTSQREQTLDHMRDCLQRLGLDLSYLPTIHVTGTKGKGSTCAFCEAILRRHGLKTGLYLSPHLVDIRERIRINNAMISPDAFASLFWRQWDRLRATSRLAAAGEVSAPSAAAPGAAVGLGAVQLWPGLADSPPSYFKFLTLMALQHFLEEKVDVAIVEVGMGGRLDATNVVLPVVTGVARLDMDHMNVLGPTLQHIAREKAGIFKLGAPAVTVAQRPEGLKVLADTASRLGLPLYMAPPLAQYLPPPLPALGIAGDHQTVNASLAVTLSELFLRHRGAPLAAPAPLWASPPVPLTHLTEGGVRDALANTEFAGRCQTVELLTYPPGLEPPPPTSLRGGARGGAAIASRAPRMTLYCDGAHTPESVEACVRWFDAATRVASAERARNVIPGAVTAPSALPSRHRLLLFHCMNTRDPEPLLIPLATHLSSPPFANALIAAPPEDFTPGWPERLSAVWESACLGSSAPSQGPAIVCASVEDALRGLCRYEQRVRQEWRDRQQSGGEGEPEPWVDVLIVGSFHLLGEVMRMWGIAVRA